MAHNVIAIVTTGHYSYHLWEQFDRKTWVDNHRGVSVLISKSECGYNFFSHFDLRTLLIYLRLNLPFLCYELFIPWAEYHSVFQFHHNLGWKTTDSEVLIRSEEMQQISLKIISLNQSKKVISLVKTAEEAPNHKRLLVGRFRQSCPGQKKTGALVSKPHLHRTQSEASVVKTLIILWNIVIPDFKNKIMAQCN